MAVRTTDALVQEILGRDWDPNRPLKFGITAGSQLVDDLVAWCTENGVTAPSAAKLKTLEGWLAAWAYCMSDRPFASKSTLGQSATFVSQTAMHLDANTYGQMARMLDPTGYLDTLSSERADFAWLGKPPSEQTDYVDRD